MKAESKWWNEARPDKLRLQDFSDLCQKVPSSTECRECTTSPTCAKRCHQVLKAFLLVGLVRLVFVSLANVENALIVRYVDDGRGSGSSTAQTS